MVQIARMDAGGKKRRKIGEADRGPRLCPAGEVLNSGRARFSAVGPGDECNAAGGLRHDERRGRSTEGDADGKRLVTRFLRERRRRGERRQCSETRSGFLFLGEALVVELAHAAMRCWKGCGRFLESRDKELMCGVGERACRRRDLVDTVEGTRLRATAGPAAATFALRVAGETRVLGFGAADTPGIDFHHFMVGEKRHLERVEVSQKRVGEVERGRTLVWRKRHYGCPPAPVLSSARKPSADGSV
ncbi:hypothetical protein DFH08DRAFT_813875 [Mycena albidolilacea]|uniref:Uncharacterized protein n=1 Tax=Mycena albidolilacea TaxID=1033008 RepID=A0AAD6ZQZ3_9AGAR|nr:hypothetical protein DFH08DRAFT_813875 [Mycena albidolilacea]